MLLRRFSFMNWLPLSTIRAQGNVRLTIHQEIAKKLLRKYEKLDFSSDQDDMLSRLCKPHSLYTREYTKNF